MYIYGSLGQIYVKKRYFIKRSEVDNQHLSLNQIEVLPFGNHASEYV